MEDILTASTPTGGICAMPQQHPCNSGFATPDGRAQWSQALEVIWKSIDGLT
jgi:hypothetical protein